MISVLSKPASPSLTGNPMVVKVACADGNGDGLQWRGVYTELITDGYFRLQSGQTIQVTYIEPSGLSLNINFISSSGSNINSIPDDTVSYPSDIAYWTAVAEKIQGHQEVNSRLKVYATDIGTGVKLIVEAIDQTPEWVVSLDVNTIPNVSVNQITVPTTTVPDEYRVFIDVFIEDSFNSGTFTKIGMLDERPSSDSTVRFDISNILDSGIKNQLPDLLVPTWDDSIPIGLKTTRNYFLRIYEILSVPQVGFGSVIIESQSSALIGGVSYNLFASNNNFLGSIIQDTCFFSWKGLSRSIDENQPEWLPYYNYNASEIGVLLEVKEYNDTDQNPIVTRKVFDDDQYSVLSGRIILLPIGARQLSISSNTAYYTVQMIDHYDWVEGGQQVTPISPIVKITIDRNYYEEIKYLQYLNTFYAPELLRCTGDFSKELETNTNDTEITLVPGFSSAIAANYTYRTDWANRFKYNTGYVSPVEMEFIQELYIYRKAYEVSSEGYIPLKIIGKKMDVATTRRNLNNQIVLAEPALQYVHYSNLMPPTPSTFWEEDNDDFWLTNAGIPWEQQ